MNDFTQEELATELSLPIALHSENRAIESFWEFSNEIGKGSFKKFVFSGIHLCFGELKLNNAKLLKIELPCSVVEMHFAIEGDSFVQDHENGEINFYRNQHNLIHYSKSGHWVGSSIDNATCSSFHIVFTEKYFLKILNTEYPTLNSFLSKFEEKRPVVLHSKNMGITSEMNSILNELTHCKRKGVLKSLFTEAKILKLLMLQLEQFEAEQTAFKKLSIKDYDIEKIHQAKSILEENLSVSISLIDLAHKAGLNDFKLKKGFKEIYGTTVFGYLNDLRMNEAKKLLVANEMPVVDISQICGYKFVQNFSKAFKLKFGITPEKFRRENF